MKDHGSHDLHLRYFLAIAQDLNLTRTAERLNLSQPALSQHLRQLEEALGQRLMERHGRGLRLTRAGEELQHLLAGVFHYIDVSVSRVRDSIGRVTGTITLAGVHPLNNYFLPSVVKQFSVDFTNVEFTLLGRTCGEVIRAVRDGSADLGLVYGTHVTVEDLAMVHLFNESMVVGCAESLSVIDQIRQRGTLPDATPMVISPRGHSLRSTIDRAFPAGKLVIRAEVETLDAMMGLAGEGLGACVVPAAVPTAYFTAFGLQRLTLQRPRLMREASVIFRKDVDQSPLLHAFIQRLRTRAKDFEELGEAAA
jgi:DNA-binding transcriptional LysR family regulator